MHSVWPTLVIWFSFLWLRKDLLPCTQQHKNRQEDSHTNKQEELSLSPPDVFISLSIIFTVSSFFILSPRLFSDAHNIQKIMIQGEQFHMQPLSSRCSAVTHTDLLWLPERFHALVVSAMYYSWCKAFMYIWVTTWGKKSLHQPELSKLASSIWIKTVEYGHCQDFYTQVERSKFTHYEPTSGQRANTQRKFTRTMAQCAAKGVSFLHHFFPSQPLRKVNLHLPDITCIFPW